MGKNWKTFLFVGAFIVMIALGGIFAIGKEKDTKTVAQNGSGEVAGAESSQSNDFIVRLAKHLRDNGMVLYGSSQSYETKEQKELFGDAVDNIDYVDCDVATNSSNPDECIGKNITIYPTWTYKGERFETIETLSELAKITNFEQ